MIDKTRNISKILKIGNRRHNSIYDEAEMWVAIYMDSIIHEKSHQHSLAKGQGNPNMNIPSLNYHRI